MRTAPLLGLAAFALASCGAPSDVGDQSPPSPPTPVASDDTPIPLSPTQRAVRASVMLRGARPSLAELQRVAADPSALERLVDTWLADPLFGETMADLADSHWHLRSTSQYLVPASGSLADEDMADIKVSLYESPLRLIRYVIENDRPYTEIVTADYLLADEITSRAWTGIEGYDPAVGGWQVVAWTDGRPHAGILSDSLLFVRFRSAGANFERGRAARLMANLICDDFFGRDVEVSEPLNLSSPEAVVSAVSSSPECATCHRTLDPIASYLPYETNFSLFGTVWPLDMYNEEWVPNDGWTYATGAHPAYYGEEGEDLADLGQQIADDPRFAQCAARHFYAFFNQVDPLDVPFDQIVDLSAEMVNHGYSAKKMARKIALSDAFAAAAYTGEPRRGAPSPVRRSSPDMLQRSIEAWTGFVWTLHSDELCCNAAAGVSPIGDVNLLTDAWLGYDTLTGGVDGAFAVGQSSTAEPSTVLVMRRLANRAAGWVVPRDFDKAPADRHLLHLVERDTTDEAAIRAQLVELQLALYGEVLPSDDPKVDAAWALFQGAIDRGGDAERAWALTLTALFQDPRVLFF